MIDIILDCKQNDILKQYLQSFLNIRFIGYQDIKQDFLLIKEIEKNKDLDDLTISEFKNICDVFEEDIYEAISVETCVNKRNTIGAPGNEAMKQVIALNDKYLETFKNTSD